jgi:CHAT domain-containing protein
MQLNLISRASLAFLVLFLDIAVAPTRATVPATIPSCPSCETGLGGSVQSAQVINPSIQAALNNPQLVQQGRNLYEAGQFSLAVEFWQQAAKAYQAENDLLNRAMVLSNLSLAYQQLGQWNQASQAIAESLNLLGYRGENRAGGAGGAGVAGGEIQKLKVLAQALNTQGSLQLALGQAEQAITTWQQAAATYKASGDRAGITRSLLNQAQALQALGLYRRALVTLNLVNQTLQKQPHSLLKVAGLRNLGNGLRVVGDLDKSRQVLQQSLAIAQKLQSPVDMGAALFSLGNTARSQQNNKAALTFYQQAAATSPSQITKLQSQLNQFSLLLDTKQLNAAQKLLPEIQSQITNLPSSSKAIYAQIDFAQSLIKLATQESGVVGAGLSDIPVSNKTISSNPPVPSSGNSSPLASRLSPLAPSLSSIAQILATSVKQAKSLGDKRAEAYALGNLGSLYEQTGQLSSAKDLTEQALLLAQSINAPDIAYRWQWQLGRLLKEQGDTPGAIASYTEAVNTLKSLRSDLVAINPEIQFSFRDEVEPVYRELVDLLLRPQANSQPSQQNLAQARTVIESLQLAEIDNFFREACLEAKSVLIDRVVDRDNPTAAVVYPIILRDRLEVILKIPQQPLQHYTIWQSQTKVEQTLEQLQQKLTEPDTIKPVKALSQKLYSWLLQPAEAQLTKSKVKTLVFVLDGSLRNIPMAALYDGKQYLVEKYAVALSPGLQLLDPKPLPQGQLKALTAGLSVVPANYPYPPLPAVKAELNSIQKAGVSISELLDQKFTSKSLETEIDSSTFNVVHLATHGQFSSQAKNTFILASDGPINVKQFDELLRNRNQHTPEAIELLVLSACETASGDKRAALGLAGVAVRAGARSTLASLWQIDDEATAIFIGEFYKELAKSKENRAEALRQAQLTLMKNYPNYSRPGYWAPYVLVGNWL